MASCRYLLLSHVVDGHRAATLRGYRQRYQGDQEWLGARWNATPAASFGAAVYHTNANRGNGNATLWTLTATYALSKRTVLYSEIATVRNSSAPIVHNAVPNGGLVLMPNPLAWRINNLPASELKRIPYTDCIPPRSTRIRH
jgi:hypothetical protein